MDNNFTKVATKVSMVSIVGNIILSIVKFFAGIIAHSSSMISDAVHSSSDVISSVVVIIGVQIASKEPDKNHPYGHERLECVAAIILATVLLVTGLFLGYFACASILEGTYLISQAPGKLALYAAVVSIVCKESMYWYTIINAKKINSSALKADAWHHRSDALSSIGALIGIGGARIGYAILEPLASFIIVLFIVKASCDIYKDAIDKMIDVSCDEDYQNKIKDFILIQDGVLAIDLLQTRLFGNRVYIDLEISVDQTLSLIEAHNIAERIHDEIENEFEDVKHIMIHVNPYIEE